ncbi:hypothetical protein VTP01DRAFT_10621 [Rhizomucor pusillus]|uniref:uncharacterized protein n=1 Tax=Rhizomucor pusillus TaxID=4840 RepID=UPI003743A8BF
MRTQSGQVCGLLGYNACSAQDNLKYILSCMDNLPHAEIIGALLFLCYSLASSEGVVFAICIEQGKIVDLPRFSLIEVLREKYVDTDRPLS